MDKTVNNNNIANPTIDDLNAEKPAENTDNSTKNINMESIRCDNNSAVFQQNEHGGNGENSGNGGNGGTEQDIGQTLGSQKKKAAKNITLCNIRSADYRNLRAVCYMVGFFQTEPSVRHMVCLRRCYNDHQ